MGLSLFAHRLPLPQRSSPKETATHEPTPSGGYGISRFDKLFEKEARRIGWPLAGIGLHRLSGVELRPEVVGWSGARGLMGISAPNGVTIVWCVGQAAP